MSDTMVERTYSEAVRRLSEFAAVTAERDERIWEAHQAHVTKAEIARVTELSWATVDRIVRDMAKKHAEEG